MSAAKKYTLYSAASTDDSGPKPCAFFASPAGCRNGDKCKFSHGSDAPKTPDASNSNGSKRKLAAAKIPESDSSSVVSSESEGEVRPAPAPASAPAPVPAIINDPPAKKQKREKKRRSTGDSDGQNPFATPKSSDGSNPFAIPKQTPATSTSVTTSCKSTSSKFGAKTSKEIKSEKTAKKGGKKETVKSKETGPATTSFLNLNLPVAPFSISGQGSMNNDAAADDSNSDSDAPQHKPVPEEVNSSHEHPPLPLPTSTAEGRQWKDAVIATRAHTRYEASFDFERYKESEPDGVESWIKAKPYGKWCESNPPAIAIDCEMCETKDPVTGATDAKALCRISIVNAVKPDEVLLDTLVKPAWPIVDYRTRINGIKAEHLETVQFTLRHAQAFMMALCSEETVITGHAVHNDLVALKMDHHCNADSAFLYSVKDEPGATPSLKDLAMAVLEKTMPNTHDSVNDARTALLCLKSYLDKEGQVDPIKRSFPKRKRGGGSGGGGDHLLVHRIPRFCKPEHITQMLLAHTFVQPKDVGEIEFGGSTGKVHVYFSTPGHAALAFETLAGEERPDKTGRSQKKVYLRNGDYVHVRSSTKK